MRQEKEKAAGANSAPIASTQAAKLKTDRLAGLGPANLIDLFLAQSFSLFPASQQASLPACLPAIHLPTCAPFAFASPFAAGAGAASRRCL